jgi:periplasmic divalent cation tolerance protein
VSKERCQLYIVETAFGSEDEAYALARALIEQKLCACCHCMPIRSLYRWGGGVCDSEEVLLRAKVLKSHLDSLVAYIRAHHSYEVPELMVSEVSCHNPSYVRWLEEQGS